MLTILLACLSRSPTPEPVTVPPDSSPSLIGQFTLTAYPGMDAVGPNGERPMPMSKEYTFTADTYTMDGYPPLTITGRYAVLTAEDDRLHIRLTDTVFDGDPSPDKEIWVDFTDGGKTMTMEGMTYARQE